MAPFNPAKSKALEIGHRAIPMEDMAALCLALTVSSIRATP
jgi:hypothetical protein